MHTALRRRDAHSGRSRRARGRHSRVLAGLVGLVALCSCAPTLHPHIDPDADFAAHTEHRGLVVDRIANGQTAEVVPGSGGPDSGGPTFVVRSKGKTLAGLWLKDDDHITVRASEDPHAPVVGRIEATWQDDAMRLVFKSADGTVFRTGVFHRVGGGAGPDVLSGSVDQNIEMRGAYAARIRDAQGTTVGWLHVQVDPETGPSRVVEGSVPAALDGPMAAAGAALIDWNVDDIENRATDVYRGD